MCTELKLYAAAAAFVQISNGSQYQRFGKLYSVAAAVLNVINFARINYVNKKHHFLISFCSCVVCTLRMLLGYTTYWAGTNDSVIILLGLQLIIKDSNTKRFLKKRKILNMRIDYKLTRSQYSWLTTHTYITSCITYTLTLRQLAVCM